MDTLFQDLRYGLRALARNRGFAAAAILTLALGIGATTAVFSIVNGVLLRPLPYANADRLAMLWTTGATASRRLDDLPFSAGNFLDVQAKTTVLDRVAAFRSWSYSLSDGGEPELVEGARVSAGLFHVLGVNPLLGRALSPEDDRDGAEKVAVLGHALWQRRFGSDRNVTGRQVTINGERYRVIGVMPPGFQFPRGAELPPGFGFAARSELWTPLALTPEQARNRGTQNLAVVGLLRRDVSLPQAQAELDVLARRLAGEYPALDTALGGLGMRLVPLRDQAVGKVRSGLLVLMGAVAFVLLIACANVANLLIARTAARQREIAIRSAVGAGRGRLVRQLITENALLSLAGGTLGFLVALWATDAILAFTPGNLPRLDDIRVDSSVLLVTLLTAMVAGSSFGILVALHASRSPLADSLREGGGKVTAGLERDRLRQALVVGEVALSLVLLAGAGLLGQSFLRLQSVPPGFDPRNTLTMQLLIPPSAELDFSREGPRWATTFREYIERLQALPGVKAAGGVTSLPLSGAWESTNFTIDGRPEPRTGAAPSAEYASVTPDYFRAMGISLKQGRAFTTQDGATSPPVIMINETMARRYWPGETAVGKHITVGFIDRAVSREIVGVVGNVHQIALDAETAPALYFPLSQAPSPFMNIVVRTTGNPLRQVAALRRELRAVDPTLALHQVRTLEQVFAKSLAQQRFSMLLLGVFATTALVLAIVGLYGVIAFAVAQRTREIGVRIALGARARDVLGLVLRQGVTLTVTGLVIGLAGARALTRFLQSELYGVSAGDPITYVAVSVILTFVALLATYIPARRATRIDPMTALRYE